MTAPSGRLLVVLDADDAESTRIQASFSRRLAAVLGKQTLALDAGEMPRQGARGRTAGRQTQSLQILIALALLLAILVPMLIVGSSLERWLTFGELSDRGQEGMIVGPRATPTPTPEGELEAYGAGFGWPDRFNNAELSREVESSKVLSPLSTVASVLMLGALLLPRTLRREHRQIDRGSPLSEDARDADFYPWVSENI